MTIDHSPYLDSIEYRCALACQSLNEASKDVREYGIVHATEEQKNLLFGVARFTEGINNIRFALFHDIRTNKFMLVFDSSKTALDWFDNIEQWIGINAELYQQAKEIAGHVRPEFRDKILFTGHSLGGGLAIVASLVCGAQAIVFNSASIHQNTLAGLHSNYSRIDQYSVKGDIVSAKIPLPGHINVGRVTKLMPLSFAPWRALNRIRRRQIRMESREQRWELRERRQKHRMESREQRREQRRKDRIVSREQRREQRRKDRMESREQRGKYRKEKREQRRAQRMESRERRGEHRERRREHRKHSLSQVLAGLRTYFGRTSSDHEKNR